MDEPTTPTQPSDAPEPVAPEPPLASASTVMPSSLPPSDSAAPTPNPDPGSTPKPRPSRRVYLMLGVLVVILIALIGWRLVEIHQQATTAAATQPATVTHATTVNPASGSDNQSLSNDLGTVNNGLNNENQAQTAATSAVNDQQQEVNVPTN